MKKGIVYILTNPSLQGWIKIGFTAENDIQNRLSKLNSSTSIPLSFRVYATLSVDNPEEIEKSIHTIFDAIDKSLHSIEKLENGKERVREFFQISPEKAYIIFKEVAKLTKCENDLILGIPTKSEIEEEEIVTKRTKVTFKELEITVGTELEFLKDSSIKCLVIDEKNTVKFQNEETTLSAIAKKLIGYNVNGFQYFMIDNETLWDRRIRMESLTTAST